MLKKLFVFIFVLGWDCIGEKSLIRGLGDLGFGFGGELRIEF